MIGFCADPGSPRSPGSLPAPNPEAAAHSARLGQRIRAEIEASGGRIPFERFMELALYGPGLGYYSAGARKFGASGDFVTAPELSALFSRCVARQCEQVLAATGGAILELGAGSGVMATDMLLELESLGCLPESYAILELSAELRRRQQATLADRAPHLLQRVRWLDSLPEPGFDGVIVANEVLDAMPVQRFRVTDRGPVPLAVTCQREHFAWVAGSADEELEAFVEAVESSLGWRFAPGYESERNPHLEPWLISLAAILRAGALLLIDYGYPRHEYYHPQRAAGTLICHYRHRMHANPLILVGLQDLTASVDFTAVADAALKAGLRVAGYTSQAYFLFGCGLEGMLASADTGDRARYLEQAQQVKLLTLPGQMGERVKAMALVKNPCPTLIGFSLFDERARL